MSREDFLSMLGEKPPDTPALDAELGDKPTLPPSPTALKLDDFSLRRGKEVLEASQRMQAAIGDESAEEAADFHALAFEPEPELVPVCSDARRHGYVKALLENPDYQALHAETMLDDVASEMAAAGFAEQWAVLVKSEQPEDPFKQDLECIKAAGEAMQGVKEDVGDLQNARQAFGLGAGPGSQLPAGELSAAFKRVRANRMLREVCNRAGRYRRMAQARQRMKTLHGNDDMVGVVMDGDVGRLLPHELAKIDDEDLELDLLRRLVERQALCREWRGVESQAKGPIVLWLDESGSMTDAGKIYDAKAIALAMTWIAMHQRRWCCLIAFSGEGQVRPIVLPPGKSNSLELMEWVEAFFNGGTYLPIEYTMSDWEKLGCPKGKTDIVCISDAITSVEPEVADRFKAWKLRENAKLTTIVVGCGEAGDLSALSDKTYTVASLGLEEDAVSDVMSV